MPDSRVPTLETARLRLCGHRLEDYAESAAMWADPAVTKHIATRPSTPEEAWTRILRHAGHWAILGFGYWVIRDREGRFVGEAGFADFRRQLDPPTGGAPEIGWALATWAHGKGFATEAVRAAVAWGDARFGSARTVCIIDPANRASIRVAQKCGYREVTRTTYAGQPTILFER